MSQILFLEIQGTTADSKSEIITHTSGPHILSSPLEAISFMIEKGYHLPDIEGEYEYKVVGAHTVEDKRHPTHMTRCPDSSVANFECINCGARDHAPGGWGVLALPCENIPLGTPVETTKSYRYIRTQMTGENWGDRQWGVSGEVSEVDDSDSVCYTVQHADGTKGRYSPFELKLAL